MRHGLPMLFLVFLVVLTLMAFWRLVLMIFAAAFLSVMVIGVIDVAGQLVSLR